MLLYTCIPYSGLFSWVQIFVKCWRWPSELIFVVLKFVANDARISLSAVRRARVHVMNSDRVRVASDHGAPERFSAESCVRGYHVYQVTTYGSPVSEKNCHVNARMVTLRIRLLWRLSRVEQPLGIYRGRYLQFVNCSSVCTAERRRFSADWSHGGRACAYARRTEKNSWVEIFVTSYIVNHENNEI